MPDSPATATAPSSCTQPHVALGWSTTLLLIALAGTLAFAGVNLDAGISFLALSLVVHLVVCVHWRVWRGNNPHLRFWQRVSTAACLTTAALWFGIAGNQVRLTTLPAQTQQRLATEYYLQPDEPAWFFAVFTGFPCREILTLRARERPKLLPRPKDPNAPHFIGTLGFGGPNYLLRRSLHTLWINFGLLLLAATVAAILLRGRWLANIHMASVPLATLATGIQIWMLVDPYALLP
jgi:hypothetical protein